MNQPVVITLRLADGREFVCHDVIDEQYADTHEIWWTDGNGSCDCNRSLSLNREHGLNLGVKDDSYDVPCLPCGDTITLVSVDVNGERRFSEPV